jgi:4-hydroxy-3-methylbut-2-en-1-yl diphosphate synthase IspG/GcpE
VGSEHPIRVQTMTTTDTKDVKATVEQVYKSAQSNHLLNSQFRFSV